MLDCAVGDGITHVVFTPHVHPGRWDNSYSSLLPHFDNVVESLASKYPTLDLSLGGEVRFSSEILEYVLKDEIPFIGGWESDKVLLLEFPHGYLPAGFENLILWLRKQGIRPMIAHPERNKDIVRDFSKLQPLVDLGCLFQLTAMSVTGDFGNASYETAHKILNNDLATVIATDAHNLKSRPPILSKAWGLVESKYGFDVAKRLLQENPSKIIDL